MSETIEAADRISQLPIYIIHKILRPLDVHTAARTSVLSKTWRQIWTSRPVFEFDRSYFYSRTSGHLDEDEENKLSTEKFKNYVGQSFGSLVAQNLNLEDFILRIPNYNCMPELESHIDRWLDTAVKVDVKVLKVNVDDPVVRKRYIYRIPNAVLSAKTITVLHITSCRLGITSESIINLSLLRKLYLEKIQDLNDYQILCLIKHSPLIENLIMSCCDGMDILHIFSLRNLKRVIVKNCGGLRKVQIEAPLLNTFTYVAKPKSQRWPIVYVEDETPCDIILEACLNLQFLTLETSCVTEKFFQALFPKLPLLKGLLLERCHMLKSINIATSRLRRLTIYRCKDLEVVEIEAPNLVSFTYKGDKMPFSFMDPSSLRLVNIAFKPPNVPDSKLNIDVDNIGTFFQKLGHLKKPLLIVQSEKDISEVHLPQVPKLCLYIIAGQKFLRKVLMLEKPKSISVLSNSESRLLGKEIALQCEEQPDCCKYWKRKFGAKKVTMIDKHTVFEDEETSDWFTWLNSVALLNQSISFLCKWRWR